MYIKRSINPALPLGFNYLEEEAATVHDVTCVIYMSASMRVCSTLPQAQVAVWRADLVRQRLSPIDW